MGRNFLSMSLSSVLVAVFVLVTIADGEKDEPKLKLVSALFRHGDRAPDTTEGYPYDPHRNHTYYPMGSGGLTNTGKLRAYRLGQELKSRYGDFLGPIYEPWAIEARSSDYDRTKMTLQLVLSGLYPPAPVQKWNDELSWQPIPTSYKRLSEDILFEPELCPKYLAELERVRASPEVLAKSARFNALMEHLERKTGRRFKSTFDMYDIYHLLTAEKASNLTLPEWTDGIFPCGELYEGASLEYEVVSYNDNLKRLNGGMFVRKISEDMTAYRSGRLPGGRKMYLYGGHETNIGSLQMALRVYEPHVPEYTSSIIIELWESDKQYFVKVLHYSGIPSTMVTKKIPGCDELCPLDTFLALTKSVVPEDSEVICVKRSKAPAPVTPSSLLDSLRNKVSL